MVQRANNGRLVLPTSRIRTDWRPAARARPSISLPLQESYRTGAFLLGQNACEALAACFRTLLALSVAQYHVRPGPHSRFFHQLGAGRELPVSIAHADVAEVSGEHWELLLDVLCERWVENPYYQYFCGEEFFQHRLVFDRSSLTRWRNRMGEERLAAPIQESLSVATRTKAI
ncbi:hypothetical protein ABIB66_007950 [Bradyrhizobium sp. F1.13.3]